MKAVRRGNRAGEESGQQADTDPSRGSGTPENLGPSTENAELGDEETGRECCGKDEQRSGLRADPL